MPAIRLWVLEPGAPDISAPIYHNLTTFKLICNIVPAIFHNRNIDIISDIRLNNSPSENRVFNIIFDDRSLIDNQNLQENQLATRLMPARAEMARSDFNQPMLRGPCVIYATIDDEHATMPPVSQHFMNLLQAVL